MPRGVKATLVIPTYRRPQNIKPILQAVGKQGVFSQVILWNNDHEVPHKVYDNNWKCPKVSVYDSPWNVGPYGRFVAAERAACDIIATQDDDYVVNNWAELLSEFDQRKGKELVAGVFYERRNGKVATQAQIACGPRGNDIMLGWGSVFDRRWIGPAFKPYLAKHGPDPLFVRKADRIFSIMLGRYHVELTANVHALPGAGEEPALHYTPHNKQWTQEARKRCRELLAAT